MIFLLLYSDYYEIDNNKKGRKLNVIRDIFETDKSSTIISVR